MKLQDLVWNSNKAPEISSETRGTRIFLFLSFLQYQSDPVIVVCTSMMPCRQELLTADSHTLMETTWKHTDCFSHLPPPPPPQPFDDPSCPVSSWTTQQVCQWLKGLNMEQYVPEFSARDIDGQELLQMDGNKLKVRMRMKSSAGSERAQFIRNFELCSHPTRKGKRVGVWCSFSVSISRTSQHDLCTEDN